MTSELHAQGTFVSEKISKIRWQHEPFSDTKTFLTGSWDNPVCFVMYICS